jgi:hypothetical protein
VLMFVSKAYAEKPWTRHERPSALARALQERREYVLPARFDDTVLEGLDPSLGYLSLRDRSPERLSEAVLQKLVQLGGRVEPAKPAFRAGTAEDGRNVCLVTVHTDGGEPLEGAAVLLIAPNGTSQRPDAADQRDLTHPSILPQNAVLVHPVAALDQ